MATGDKLFLATQSDVQEFGSKVDVVDTTTKDTNSKVISLTSTAGTINETASSIDTKTTDMKISLLSIGAKIDELTNSIGGTSTTGWGKTAISKTFTQYNSLTQEATDVAYLNMLTYFIPPVSGLYTIRLSTTTNKSHYGSTDWYMLTDRDLLNWMNTNIIMNQLKNSGTMTGSFYDIRQLISDLESGGVAMWPVPNKAKFYNDFNILKFGTCGWLGSDLTSEDYNKVYLQKDVPYILTGLLDEQSGGQKFTLTFNGFDIYYGNETNPH